MANRYLSRGFSLVELLLVLALIGILSGIAIPTLRGQRQRARRLGDAEANARVIAMALETLKADTGQYGPANATATWTPDAAGPAMVGYTASPAPLFTAQGNSQMTYILAAQPLTYTIDVWDGGAGGTHIIQLDQSGAKTVYAH
jgi:prepilin-type N-terminal cleavage/methylation domain-containing protein